ncbi:MAG: TIGR01777 family oxidoreductase [Candidatus Aminicenantes bacterium]|nr:MAG: TIGR01777 family oxidoreductase [Candidatus Aminicenantes bacterium]
MNIFLTGGSGFIGSTLTQRMTSSGHKVTLLTRSIKKGRTLPEGASFLEANPMNPGPWQEKVAENEVIINLAGASIFTRWNKKTKRNILESRILTTNHIVEALQERKSKETHLINASAVGYYGFHGDEILDETGAQGNDFLASVAKEWESAALTAQKFGVRVVLCRFGIVLGKHGGTLSKMVPAFKHNLGSPFGSGKQWFSWIHEQDLADIILFFLEQKGLEGPANCTAPNPVRNRELTKILGQVLQKRRIFPSVPGFVLKLMLGEFGNIILKGQRVIPQKLLDNGFSFKFPFLKEALQDLLI